MAPVRHSSAVAEGVHGVVPAICPGKRPTLGRPNFDCVVRRLRKA